ncbi:MAG: hypothetical protein HDS62_08355 [Bacteroidales bacterium]|nr:hypothetical protein [Bacteroidales bacterium]
MTVKELITELSKYPQDMEVSLMRDDTEDYEGGAFVVESIFYDEEVGTLIID